MQDHFLNDYILNYDSFLLKDFGVFHLDVDQAAELVARILCLEGSLEIELPDKEAGYSLYDEDLSPLLSKEIDKYKTLILSGIEKSTLKTAKILRNPDESISTEDTYLETDVLREWLEERSIDISGDWYAEYLDNEQKVAQAAVHAIEVKRALLEKKDNQKQEVPLEEQVVILEARILELETEKIEDWHNRHLENPKIPQKPLHVKERETLLKLIIGMAVKGYAYDPKANRSSTVRDISEDLDLLGISLDEDTIRRWIKRACEFLPQTIEKSNG